jgi:putative peptide zinc metalloprotease protein
VVESNACLFSAVIPQQQASRLFAERIAKAEVRLRGQAGTDLPVSKVEVLPADQRLLPSAALGWLAGGEVALDMSDPRGRTTREPFFVVQAEIASHPGAIQLLHGRSGRIRFEFGAEPLLQQWLRKLQQLIQKRYQRQ